jgi:hypothetical protein
MAACAVALVCARNAVTVRRVRRAGAELVALKRRNSREAVPDLWGMTTIVFSREVAAGWIAQFRGGLELEICIMGDERWACWSADGTPLGFSRWGLA